MPTTTTRGNRVPLDADPFPQGAAAMRNAVADVERMVRGKRIVVNLSGTTPNDGQCLFSPGFPGSEVAYSATIDNAQPQNYAVSVTGTSAAGCTVRVTRLSGSATAVGVYVIGVYDPVS